jgi:hypothetical protein
MTEPDEHTDGDQTPSHEMTTSPAADIASVSDDVKDEVKKSIPTPDSTPLP